MTTVPANKKRKRRTTEELLADLELEKIKIAEREKELITRRNKELKALEEKKIKEFYNTFASKYPDLNKMNAEEIVLFVESIYDLDKEKTISTISDILN